MTYPASKGITRRSFCDDEIHAELPDDHPSKRSFRNEMPAGVEGRERIRLERLSQSCLNARLRFRRRARHEGEAGLPRPAELRDASCRDVTTRQTPQRTTTSPRAAPAPARRSTEHPVACGIGGSCRARAGPLRSRRRRRGRDRSSRSCTRRRGPGPGARHRGAIERRSLRTWTPCTPEPVLRYRDGR